MSNSPDGNFHGMSNNETDAHRVCYKHVLHYANALVLLTSEETGRCDLAWKDLCSVLNALSK